MVDTLPEKMYTVAQVALRLGVCTRSIHHYIRDGLIENVIVLPHTKRSHYRIPEQSVQAFKRRYSQNLRSEKRPKRTYNRRVVKGKHKKRKDKRG